MTLQKKNRTCHSGSGGHKCHRKNHTTTRKRSAQPTTGDEVLSDENWGVRVWNLLRSSQSFFLFTIITEGEPNKAHAQCLTYFFIYLFFLFANFNTYIVYINQDCTINEEYRAVTKGNRFPV